MKRTLFFMLLSALLWGGAATAQAETYSGECGAEGNNLTWTLNTQTGGLEISGTGAMKNYYYDDRAPWYFYYITSVTIGNEVTTIGNWAFSYCYELKSITIPNSVTSIGNYAFYYCSGLTEITIPEGVTSISSRAFSYCSGLTDVYFNAENCSQAYRCFYYGCTALTTIHIGENVKQIPDNIFSGCTGLTEITIPNSVETIGEGAFSGCTGLTSITIPESVTTIGIEAFYNCPNLARFEGKWASSDNRCLVLNDTLVAFARGGLSSYTIPDNIKVIGERAFEGSRDLTSVTIPESVTTIGIEAFYNCPNLARFEGKWASSDNRCLVLNDTLVAFARGGLSSYTIPDNIKVIGERAFEGSRDLTSVTIPESVISIGGEAFAGCYNLKEVRFNAISCINGSFASCKALTTVYIGNHVKQIPGEAFVGCENLTKVYFNAENCTQTNGCFSASNGCTALTTVNIGENVKQIPDEAFADCSRLTSITIGAGVNAIGERAFAGCTSLTSVAAYNPTPITIANDLFEDVDCANCTLYVPAGSADLYKAAEGWNKFGAILPAIESVSDSLWYTNQSEDGKGIWDTYTPTWLSSPEAENATLFAEGKIAVFDDNDLSREDNKDIHTYFVDLQESFSIGGLRVDNDSITYRISIPEDNEYTLTGTEDAVFEKKGSGAFYNDAPLTGITTELYEGTIGRNSWQSRFLPVYGEKVVVKGKEATIDVGWKSDETGISSIDRSDRGEYYRLGTDLEIPEGSTLNIIGPRDGSGGYFWCDTNKVAKVTGKSTINFKMPGSRFIMGGGTKGETEMGADFSGFDGTINVEKIGDDSTTVSRVVRIDENSVKKETIKVPVFSNLIFGPATLLGKNKHTVYYDQPKGDSMLYNIWRNRPEFLDSITVNMKNVDMHVGNWGTLACASSGAQSNTNITLVHLRSLNVEPTGMIIGFYKYSNPKLALMFGSDNKDCYIHGTVTSAVSGKNGSLDTMGLSPSDACGVHLIKEGTGTCYLTANDNQIQQGIDVYQGAMMFNNTENTATGRTAKGVVCYKDGTIGGWGAIGCAVHLYGTLQPGSNSVSTLRLTGENNRIWYTMGVERDKENPPTHNLARGNTLFRTTSVNSGKQHLNIYAGATDRINGVESAPRLDMEITDKDHHDMVEIDAELRVYDAQEGKIKVKVAPRDTWELNEGDTIVLIKAQGERSYEWGKPNPKSDSSYVEKIASSFNTFVLEPTAAFTKAGVECHLAEVGTKDRITKNYDENGWELVLVVDKGGKGEAPLTVKDFIPTNVIPDDSSEVEALKTFTLEFVETPSLAAEAKTITLAGNDTLLTAGISVGERNTLVVTLTDTLKTAGTYTLTIPEGTFGDSTFADDPTTGRCNPALTYVYTIKDTVPDEPESSELKKDFMPMRIAPVDSTEVTELAAFTLLFDEKPFLVGDSATLMKADSSAYFPADIVVSSDSTLTITLTDTVVTEPGDYLLAIPESIFGDEIYFADQTTGRCNPALTYVYTIKDTVPDEPESSELKKDFIPTRVTPTDSTEVTELWQFTFTFDTKPVLVYKSATLGNEDGTISCLAEITEGEGNTLVVTLKSSVLTTAGTYTLTIFESSFGDAAFAADQTTGHCNPELTYTYTIKEPEPVEPDDPSSITETQADAEHIAVYNMQGVLVLETNDAADLKTLQNGAYIVNGKKMIIVR